MLCFDREVAADLERLKAVVEVDFKIQAQIKLDKGVTPKPMDVRKAISKVIYLDGGAWFQESKQVHEKEIFEAFFNLRTSLKSFAAKELDWVRPNRNFENGQWRTVQMVLPFRHRAALLGKIGNRKRGVVEGVKEMEGCVIKVTWAGGGEREQLVSLTGARERLRRAEEWVRGLC
jgi:hypothetical protein